MPTSPKKSEPATFEDAMTRLNAVVKEMESGELNLDAMVTHFEEGQALVAFCNKKLGELERKVEVLVRKPDGTVSTEPCPENVGK